MPECFGYAGLPSKITHIIWRRHLAVFVCTHAVSPTMQVTEFIDMASGKGMSTGGQKTVVLGESFGAMLGIRLGQLR